MLPYKKSANITNVIFDQEIYYSREVEYFTEIAEMNPIPTNSIIYKTVTGIGATHSEIVAERDSIIVLPHISIIKSKHKYYKEIGIDTLAIYGGVTLKEIDKYLFAGHQNLKILTTPKGVNKVIKLMNNLNDRYPEIQYQKIFFLLIDECHKYIKDADYRHDMPELMQHFFQFENKAMVSATPIPPSDPRFIDQGFKNIKVCPDYYYKQNVELIHAESLVNGMQRYLNENESEHYFIFFNSLEGIKDLLDKVGIVSDYSIFCSLESAIKLKPSSEVNASSELGEFKKFNFFTSSFFNGLDIIVPYKPNVVLLTDCGYRTHTMLDPYTDVLQIVGRFRKNETGELPYNKLTHINNAKSFTTPISESQALDNIKLSEHCHKLIDTLKYSLNGETLYPLFDQALTTVKPYYSLLGKDKKFCHFLKDNYLDDERVKNYYQSTTALRNAYWQSGLFNVDYKIDKYNEEEIIKLQRKSIGYSKEMNILMANTLLDLEDYRLLDVYYEQRHVVKQLSYIICEAFDRLGYHEIAALKFSKRKIEKALLRLNIEEGKNAFPVIDVMHTTFALNQYYFHDEIKPKLQEIYDELGIDCTATATDVERYFEHKSKDSKKNGKRVYIFTRQKMLGVAKQKHI